MKIELILDLIMRKYYIPRNKQKSRTNIFCKYIKHPCVPPKRKTHCRGLCWEKVCLLAAWPWSIQDMTSICCLTHTVAKKGGNTHRHVLQRKSTQTCIILVATASRIRCTVHLQNRILGLQTEDICNTHVPVSGYLT
jgi:hypothetical protein